LVFLNDDVEPLVDSWLSDLVGQVQRSDIGAAGARLLYPSGTIQHAGITIGIGDGCGHVGRGTYYRRYWPWLDATRNVSAVTGACLAVRKQVFVEVGGFDDLFPMNYNDVDLCLRILRSGYRIVCESAAVLRHYECQTRRGGVALPERQQWYTCWADEVDRGDPFYSPNLTRMGEDASLGSGQ
jgi:GT2 family glycosyltransferase